ncbi:hypothetical protein MMC26_003659 [Xylographa opegraphella]|nr:hypothetical protein [Xylographa opegraphella]
MAEKVIDQLAPSVRGMLRILHLPDVEEEDLPELIIRLGQITITVQNHCVEKNGAAGLTSCPIEFVSPQTPPRSPASIGNETLDARRTSERLASSLQKRSYVAMQSGGASRSKRRKPTAPSESIPAGSIVENPLSSEYTINDFPRSESAVFPPIESEASEALTNDTLHQCPSENLLSLDQEPLDQQQEGGCMTLDHEDGLDILDGYFSSSPLDMRLVDDTSALDMSPIADNENVSQMDSPKQSTSSEPSTNLLTSIFTADHTNKMDIANKYLPSATIQIAKRPILDESGHRLEDVVKALDKADDTSRIPDSHVPGTQSSDGQAMLDIEQERLRNFERHEIERIAEDRQQMNMTLPARLASEINLQQYTERLKKNTESTIAHLDIRILAEKELLDTISESTELTGEFKEDSDYANVIKTIEKAIANDTRAQQRSLWKETYFWPMIQQRAKMIGPLPVPPGRKTEITPQEKIAAKQLISAIGHGTCRDNVCKWTSYWKLLCDIEDRRIFERLRTAQTGAWANDISVWNQDQTEYERFLANHNEMATSGKSNEYILCHGVKGKLASNKSIFVGMVPYEGESGKRVIGKKPALAKQIAISPLVSVAPGDFLGIFSGKLRYMDRKPSRAIKAPVPGLWLDYLEIPGKLNQTRVAKLDEKANVCLAWEGVNEVKGEKSFCQNWRVLVVATRDIMPFDQLIRPF